MKNFAIGLVLLMLGALVWFISSLFAGVGQAVGEPAPLIIQVFVPIGFFVMIGGPLTFWVVIPVWRYLRRR